MATTLIPAPSVDPRQTGWPCQGNHLGGRQRSNKFATWQICEKCGLRLNYVAKAGYSGENRSVGPLPQHVSLAQTELSQIYSVAEMNHKIFMGKLLEIKGRVMVQSNGATTPNVEVKAKSRQGQALLTASSTTPGTSPGTASTGNPTSTPAPKAAAQAKPKARAAAAPPVVVNVEEEPESIQVDNDWEISGNS